LFQDNAAAVEGSKKTGNSKKAKESKKVNMYYLSLPPTT
jgi:hypothetical protein